MKPTAEPTDFQWKERIYSFELSIVFPEFKAAGYQIEVKFIPQAR